jgi:hypothetical protein
LKPQPATNGFVKLVEPLACRVVLAHPKKLRIIAESKRKSDKLDAQVLAEFLASNMAIVTMDPDIQFPWLASYALFAFFAGVIGLVFFRRGGAVLGGGRLRDQRELARRWRACGPIRRTKSLAFQILTAGDLNSAQRRSNGAVGITLLSSAIRRMANSAKASGESGLAK